MKHIKVLHQGVVIAMLLAVIVYSIALAATSVTLRGYDVDFIEVTGTGDTREWVYAVTADGTEDAALAHFLLSVDVYCGYKVISPRISPPNPQYVTPTSYILQTGSNAGMDICTTTYDCVAGSYNVDNYDAVSGLRGAWLISAADSLSDANPGTHIFRVTLENLTEHRRGDNTVSVSSGEVFENGLVTGPVCPPTAVELVNLSAATSTSVFAMVGLLAASLLALVLVAFVVIRR